MEITLVVKMNFKTGSCEVTGPIDMKPICIKALAAAINAVCDFTPKPPAIVIPNGNGAAKAN